MRTFFHFFFTFLDWVLVRVRTGATVDEKAEVKEKQQIHT